jgi:hypothetical protein
VGSAGVGVANDLVPGRGVRLELAVPGIPAGTQSALGGGPALVVDGVPVTVTDEGFSPAQLTARTSRTGIGQTAAGDILLVTSEGPAQGSRGISTVEQGALMARLGAQTAIGMDAGGSALMTLGDQLVIPWSSERAITDALLVTYRGVQLTPIPVRLSPNADGVDDGATATVRSPLPGQVSVTLNRRRGGAAATLFSGPLGPGSQSVTLDPARLAALPDGPYALVAALQPADGITPPSTQRRPVILDRTLERLLLRPARTLVGGARRPVLQIRFGLFRPANVTVRVLDAGGTRVLRTLRAGRRLAKGPQVVVWDRTLGRRPASGTYTVSVAARTFLGTTQLTRQVTVTAPAPPPTAPTP